MLHILCKHVYVMVEIEYYYAFYVATHFLAAATTIFLLQRRSIIIRYKHFVLIKDFRNRNQIEKTIHHELVNKFITYN